MWPSKCHIDSSYRVYNIVTKKMSAYFLFFVCPEQCSAVKKYAKLYRNHDCYTIRKKNNYADNF